MTDWRREDNAEQNKEYRKVNKVKSNRNKADVYALADYSMVLG